MAIANPAAWDLTIFSAWFEAFEARLAEAAVAGFRKGGAR
jgi:hypothetical protein